MKHMTALFLGFTLTWGLASPAMSEEPELVGGLSMPSVIGEKTAVKVEVSPFERAERANLLTAGRKREKNLWATSWLFVEIPRLDEAGTIIPEPEAEASITTAQRIGEFLKIEEWYGEAPPNLEGKYVMVEFSATWCPACRREIPDLNRWHEKFGDELVVISIYETDRYDLDVMPGDFQGKDLNYYVGIDTKRRCADALGVFGIPHAVLLEPQYGGVVWEGMPNQPNYELTDEMIERILAVGRRQAK